MISVSFKENKDETYDLIISSYRKEDGATTETRWEGKSKDVALRTAHSHLNDFKNALDKQQESWNDLETRIPKMRDAQNDILEVAIPNLKLAIEQLEEIVPEDYDPIK
tara:strand:+ start:334 stop:657 length:324 start_codon:yes stop_codon:yes gene_type:complete